MKFADTAWGVGCVWLRYFDVFRKNILYAMVITFTEPILYLLAFGYGLGAMIGNVTVSGHVVTYRQFIYAGIVAQAVLFQAFFDAAYGSFIRMYYQKIFRAMATTPITLSEVLWGELLWDASKATFSSTVVLLLGTLSGDFSPTGALCCIPLCFLGSVLFAGFGLWTSALAETIDQINYPQYLIIFPMFLFCGVYFPLQQLPKAILVIAWCLPLTSLVSLVRTLTLGFPYEAQTVPILFSWLLLFVFGARRSMIRRLIK